jgi:hypothetical protein
LCEYELLCPRNKANTADSATPKTHSGRNHLEHIHIAIAGKAFLVHQIHHENQSDDQRHADRRPKALRVDIRISCFARQ